MVISPVFADGAEVFALLLLLLLLLALLLPLLLPLLLLPLLLLRECETFSVNNVLEGLLW